MKQTTYLLCKVLRDDPDPVSLSYSQASQSLLALLCWVQKTLPPACWVPLTGLPSRLQATDTTLLGVRPPSYLITVCCFISLRYSAP